METDFSRAFFVMFKFFLQMLSQFINAYAFESANLQNYTKLKKFNKLKKVIIKQKKKKGNWIESVSLESILSLCLAQITVIIDQLVTGSLYQSSHWFLDFKMKWYIKLSLTWILINVFELVM